MPLIIGVLAGSNTRASLGSAEESCFAVAAGVVVTVPGAGLTCSGQGPVAGLNCAIGLSFGGFAAGSCLVENAISLSFFVKIAIGSCSVAIFGFAVGIVDSYLVTASCSTD